MGQSVSGQGHPAGQHVAVLGAGTVGVCTALYLQRAGFRVTLIDRDEPGRGCSYGNGGLIQTGACVPIATPGILAQVPRMLLNPDLPLVIRWQYLPSLMPYLTRFVLAAAPNRVESISIALAALLARAADAYAPLIAAAGAQDLVRPSGELYVYETEASYQAAKSAHDLRRKRGVEVAELSADELRQTEPALAPIFKRGVMLPNSIQTLDPFVFTSALARQFVADGGTVLREAVTDIEIGPDGPATLVTTATRRPVDQLVVAFGAYSRPWAKRLGVSVPLNTERGYHLMLTKPGVEMRVPVLSGDYRFGMVPMIRGVRLAGTAELAALDAPANYERAERLLKLAQRIVPALSGAQREHWMGHRPSTPDSLPVIGRSPRHRSVYFAFGHGHLGLTLGAITGRCIADLAAGRPPEVDMTPYEPARYSWQLS